MAYDKELYQQVALEYEEIRRHDRQDLEDRRAKVFAVVPELEEIETEVQNAGLKIIQLAISGGGDLTARIQALRDRQKALLIRRKSLLLEHGFAEDELSMRYLCDRCEDTGVYEDKDCECFRRRLILKAFEHSNLSMQLRDQSFKTMNMDFYSREIDERYGTSPYECMLKIVSACRRYVQNFETENTSLLFWGDPGLGKTFLSTCVAKELIKNGHSVIYETAYKIFSMLEDFKFRRTDQIEKLRGQTQKLYECDLLILDDLGAEFSTNYTNAALFDILNTRLIANKKTIINTNLNLEELAKKYSERVFSRIIGHYQALHFIGRDIRLQKSMGGE